MSWGTPRHHSSGNPLHPQSSASVGINLGMSAQLDLIDILQVAQIDQGSPELQLTSSVVSTQQPSRISWSKTRIRSGFP